MIVYGIDIGLTGAVAVIVDGELRDVADIPAHCISAASKKKRIEQAGLAAVFRAWRAAYGVDAEFAVMENVSSSPQQGVTSAFSFGHSFGACEGVVKTLGIPLVLVTPSKWKAAMGLSANKAEAQALASQMFPTSAGHWPMAKHHNRAEAALLAAYGWKERV